MGDLTEQIVDGTCCVICFAPFEQDNGFPAICWECWGKTSPDKDGFVGDAQRSVFKQMEGKP